jgi:hypothetical protein
MDRAPKDWGEHYTILEGTRSMRPSGQDVLMGRDLGRKMSRIILRHQQYETPGSIYQHQKGIELTMRCWNTAKSTWVMRPLG